jgi:hypothetical protein
MPRRGVRRRGGVTAIRLDIYDLGAATKPSANCRGRDPVTAGVTVSFATPRPAQPGSVDLLSPAAR